MCTHALGFAAASREPHFALDVVIFLGNLFKEEKKNSLTPMLRLRVSVGQRAQMWMMEQNNCCLGFIKQRIVTCCSRAESDVPFSDGGNQTPQNCVFYKANSVLFASSYSDGGEERKRAESRTRRVTQLHLQYNPQ